MKKAKGKRPNSFTTYREKRGVDTNVKKNSIGFRSIVAVAALCVLVVAGCGSGKKEDAAASRTVGAIPVQTAPAVRTNLALTKVFSASLEGEEQANIVAKISERITDIQVHVGETAASGKTIIALDKSGATSQYFQAEAGYKNAEKTLQRMKSLYAEGAISLQQLDGTQTAYDVAKANFDAARSSVELTTPIAGVMTALNVNVGDLTTPGAVLATIANVNRMKAIFSINEADASGIRIGQKVFVYSESKSDTKAEGKVVQVSRSADVRSRTFEIKALLSNSKDGWFKPGMYCKVAVQLTPRANVITVPNGSIVSDGMTSYLYVVREKRALRRAVVTGVTDGDRTEIAGGIAEGDLVITVGATNVKDSSDVVIAGQK